MGVDEREVWPQELPTVDTACSVKDLKVQRTDFLKGRVTPGFVSRPFVGTHDDVSCRDPYIFFWSTGIPFVTPLLLGTLLFR